MTHAPLAFQTFALTHPEEVKPGGPESVVLTETNVAAIRYVNQWVNGRIVPRHDVGADTWSLWPTYGDCDDYVVTKRHELIKRGLPPSALRYVFCRTPQGEDHAVLLIKCNGSDDLVLDNRTKKILHPKDTGLRFVSLSGADPSVWSDWK